MVRSCVAAAMLCLGLCGATQAFGQAKTEVPERVAGASAAVVEHIKIKGAWLEGNLEGNAAERDVLVFLPPSYQREQIVAIR